MEANNNAAQQAAEEPKFENVADETTTTQQEEPKWYHKATAKVVEVGTDAIEVVQKKPLTATVIALFGAGAIKLAQWSWNKASRKKD